MATTPKGAGSEPSVEKVDETTEKTPTGSTGKEGAGEASNVEEAASIVKQSRKRTKSGCLTCRRRRIKCGEERPICHNCVKSKRNCEGYNQRVIFKDPVNGFRPGHPEAPLGMPIDVNRFHHLSPTGLPNQSGVGPPNGYGSQAQLPNIAPRPVNAYTYTTEGPLRTPPTLDGDVQNGWTRSGPNITPRSIPNDLAEYQRRFGSQASDTSQESGNLYAGSAAVHSTLLDNTDAYAAAAGGAQYGLPLDAQTMLPTPEQAYTSPPITHDSTPEQAIFPPLDQQSLSDTASPDLGLPWGQYNQLRPNQNAAVNAAGLDQAWTTQANIDQIVGEMQYPVSGARTLDTLSPGLSADGPLQYPMLTPEEEEDIDDPYDIATDDEMDAEFSDAQGLDATDHRPAVASAPTQVSPGYPHRAMPSTRSHVGESTPSVEYGPSKELPANMKTKTRQIFCHFIAITASSVSIFERYDPANPSLLALPPPPLSHPILWTYTLPKMALTNPPLMHAILALSSLHIAKLHGDSMIPSMKHYHKALQGVAKCVSNSAQRGKVTTLAATMLLGFWEVMAAEHNKWNSHLLGARQLLVETDFVALSKRVKARMVSAAPTPKMDGVPFAHLQQHRAVLQDAATPGTEAEYQRTVALARLLMGRENHPQHDNSLNEGRYGVPDASQTAQHASAEEIKDDEVRTDLFWWFLKQDLFQSVLSGNPLLLSFDHWSDCPPRAAIGKVDAEYGTCDHLVILLGRIARFASRDQKRKRKVMEVNGGQWRPPAGMKLGSPKGPPPAHGMPPSHSGMPPSAGPRPSSSDPIMFGMMPPRGRGEMPKEFYNEDRQSPSSSVATVDEQELEAATVEAEEEWKEIKQAMQVFEDNLGPGWQPCSPDHVQPLSTPFGPATHYRTKTIANIWAAYYMAQIILERSHPDMPAAAMMAAGIAARKTTFQATEIARVVAGLLPPGLNKPTIDSSHRGALIEASMPLFFAGVQYTDAAQRGWTVRKLQDIARLSGWETSLTIASGCESAWEKAGEAGRGAPYTRTLNPWAKDDRIAGRKPNYSLMSPDDNNDRRLIEVDPKARVHWAVGLLGFEEDFQGLGLDDVDEGQGSRDGQQLRC